MFTLTVLSFAQLKVWTTLEMNGFIYLWYHAEGSQPHWFPERFPLIDSGAWKYRGRSEFQVGCHIQEIPENGADIAHLNIVHDVAIMAGGEPDFAWTKWDFIKHVWNGKWRVSEEPGEEHVAIMNLQHEMFLVNKFPLLMMNVEVKQVIVKPIGGKCIRTWVKLYHLPILMILHTGRPWNGSTGIRYCPWKGCLVSYGNPS